MLREYLPHDTYPPQDASCLQRSLELNFLGAHRVFRRFILREKVPIKRCVEWRQHVQPNFTCGPVLKSVT